MEKKKKLNNWQPRYPVVDAEEEGLNNWFKDNPYVTGMAIGAGSNGITGPRRTVHNPYSKIIPWKWDPRWKGLDKIETVRHDMDEMNYKPNFQLSPEQRILQNTPLEKGGVKGTPYETDDNAFKQSIMSRIIAGDTINLRITPEQINEYKIYFKNKYSNGGELSDEQYYNIMRKVAEENNPKWNEYRTKEGEKQLSVEQDYTRLLNSNDYDYRGYYNKYPESAANANTHWPDEFKTAWHPTFSIESRYSGVKNSKYNPLGLPGGFWSGDIFIPRAWQFLENKDYYKPKYQLGGFLRKLVTRATNKGIDLAGKALAKGTRKLIRRTQSNTTKRRINDVIDLARNGNAKAIQQLKQYGIEPGNPGVYRFISQEEADNILKGGRYAGRFNDGRVDVTANPNGTTAANSSFRITFKPEFDLYKPSQRVRMKNSELQDGWIMDGYGLDDVATIERRLPNGNYEPYKGQITITPQNAASMTPELWTAAQDAAVARGDMAEAQRLRDLHFATNAPNTVIKNVDGTPAHVYHGTLNKGWNSYDKRKFGTSTDNGMYGEGLYATSDKSYADVYARGNNADGKYIGEIKDLYVNGERPFYVFNKKDLSPREIVNREDAAYQFGRTLKVQNDIPTPIWDEMTNSDIVIETKGTKRPNFAEVVVPRGGKIKLADAVTYDNNGRRIPLGERDNFKRNDIRYGLIPFVGLAGLTLKNK